MKPLVWGTFAMGCVGAALLPPSTDVSPLTRATAIIPTLTVISLLLCSVSAVVLQQWRGKDYKKNKLCQILQQLAHEESAGFQSAKGYVQFFTVD
jgi:hypothetical protein